MRSLCSTLSLTEKLKKFITDLQGFFGKRFAQILNNVPVKISGKIATKSMMISSEIHIIRVMDLYKIKNGNGNLVPYTIYLKYTISISVKPL